MREIRRAALGGALGVMLGALPAADAGAQLPVPDLRYEAPAVTAPLPRPTALESHYTRIRIGGGSAERRIAEGAGLRLVFGRRALDDEADASDALDLAHRTELALFAAHAREVGRPRDLRLATTSMGVAADVRPFAQPVAGRLEPFVSLGAGVLRTRDMVLAPPLSLRWRPGHVARMHTSAAVLPGAGARLHVTSRVALQAEARDQVVMGGRSRHDVALGAGLRLAL